MITLLVINLFIYSVSGYFTNEGNCPQNVKVQENFRLDEFFQPWYQVYHYSSDGEFQNNCSTLDLQSNPSGIYLNQSRVDRGLFHRYSIAMVERKASSDEAVLNLKFEFIDAPRRLKTRRYVMDVLSTNYNYYATVYTCQYSPLINKHYIYIWILSRYSTLNEVSKELALKPLQQLGFDTSKLVKDDRTKCTPKYYEDRSVEPLTFRYPVPI